MWTVALRSAVSCNCIPHAKSSNKSFSYTLTALAYHPLLTIPFLMGLENSLMSETAMVDSTSTNILILSKQNMEI
jgi:hypothetical protein